MTEVATIKRAGFLDEMFRFGGAAEVTIADTSTATSATEAQTSARVLVLVGALTAKRTLTLRARADGADWVIANLTTGSQVVTVQTPTGGGVDVGPSEVMHLVRSGGLLPAPYTLDAGSIRLVDVGDTNPDPVVLDAKQSAARVVWIVGTMDGAGIEVSFDAAQADNKRVTVYNLTNYAIAMPDVTSGSAQIPAGTSRTYTWSSGGLLETVERSMGERVAGRVCSISTTGATTFCPDAEVSNGIAITKNGAGDYSVDYTAVAGIGTIQGAQCTPLGSTPVSYAVQLVSAYIVRVRMSADAPFTLSVLI